MSQISKALKKAQEIRLRDQGPSTEDMPPNANAFVTPMSIEEMPPSAFQNNLILIVLTVGILISIVINIIVFNILIHSETKQNKVIGLEDTLKEQDNKINDLITLINKNKTYTDNQRTAIKNDLENENKDIKNRIYKLTLNNKISYDNLINAIQVENQNIDYLNNNTNKLNQKIEAMTTSTNQAISQIANKINSQAQDSAIPSISN